MGIAIRQIVTTARSTATSLGRTYGSSVLAGSLLIAHGSWFASGSTGTATFSDNINGTWGTAASTGYSLEGTGGGVDGWIELAAFPNSSAGSITVTINPPGASSDNDLTLFEVTGAFTSSPRDISVTNAGTFTGSTASNENAFTSSVVTGTLSQANELVIFSFSHSATTAALATDIGDGFTQGDENESNASGQAFNLGYKITSVTTSIDCNGTKAQLGAGGSGTTYNWWSAVASYKELSTKVLKRNILINAAVKRAAFY